MTSAASTTLAAVAPSSASGKLRLALVTLAIVAAAELIGPVQFSVGPGKVALLPMLWALLIAAAWGIAHRRVPGVVRVATAEQSFAGGLLNAGLLLFVVKLGLTVGAALPQVKQAGWALLFQEFGHALGTLALGLPLALLLGIKREAVGATFSVGREGNLVIIGEKYGMASPEGRGVLAEYITGTVLGALFIAVLAGFVASLHIFDPRSLAMGAGVGSGSLMAAALGAIAAQQPAEMLPQLTAIAAASNLLTTVAGFYFTLFLSLPLCSWLYGKLEPVLGRFSKRGAQDAGTGAVSQVSVAHGGALPLRDTLIAWAVVGGGVLIGNSLTYKVPMLVSLMEELTRTRTTAAWVTLLEDKAVPCGPINDIAQAFDDAQVKARGLAVTLPRDAGDGIASITGVASPLRLTATPPVLRHAPPALGQHTQEVLAEMGIDAARFEALRSAGVV